VSALLWPLISWLAWAQPATVVVGITVEAAALASLQLVGVGPASICNGGTKK
jgi:hypothetical protein